MVVAHRLREMMSLYDVSAKIRYELMNRRISDESYVKVRTDE